MSCSFLFFFFFQAEDGIRDHCVTGVQTCALPISGHTAGSHRGRVVAAVHGMFGRGGRMLRMMALDRALLRGDRKSTRLNSSHTVISYAVFCLKKKNSPASANRAHNGQRPREQSKG